MSETITTEAHPAALPQVTVVVTCYSGQKYLEDTIMSIRAQTYPNIRILMHDNGCSPGYRQFIAQLASRVGADVATSEKNHYGETLRYEVMPNVAGDYVAILHDDDYFYPSKIATSIAAMESRSLDYLFTDRQCVDAAGLPIGAHEENLNMDPVAPGDFPTAFLAEFFYKGMRLHFSTLVLTGEVARKGLLGDPFLPRIADCLFFTRLLIDPKLKGDVLPDRLTAVRIHGENDYLYSKFDARRQAREFAQLSASEYYIFQEIVRGATLEQLKGVLSRFPGIPLYEGEDEVDILMRAAFWFRPWTRSKKLMATFCVHESFARDPFRALHLGRQIAGTDGNFEMQRLYNDYFEEEMRIFGAPEDASTPLRRQLATVLGSRSWKMTAPFRRAARRLRGAAASDPDHLEAFLGFYPDYRFGDRVSLGDQAADPFILSGFSQREDWGRWTVGTTARLRLRHPPALGELQLELEIANVFAVVGLPCEIAVAVNAGPATHLRCEPARTLIVPVDRASLTRLGTLEIDIFISRPKQAGDPPLADGRPLGVGIASIRLAAPSLPELLPADAESEGDDPEAPDLSDE